MKLNTLKKTLLVSAFGLITLLGTTQMTSAQNRQQNRNQQQKIEKQQDKINRQQDKISRQQDRIVRQQQQVQNMRYRVYRNGSYYQTDDRGAALLRQAVNNGYQQGVRVGQADRGNRRNNGYANSSIYRSGNYGYQSYVDSKQYQYYFQQGFQRGYQDGYNSRFQYGSNNNGGFNILGNILQGILNIQQY